jgi:SAM-dependent methyltransferase
MKIDHKESYKDFGNQFKIDNDIGGYWGSKSLLKQIVYPFNLNLIEKKTIAEVGSGSGRILKNLLTYSPKKIVAIEPSQAIEVAKKNIQNEKVEFLNLKGQDINFEKKFDFVFSLCVIHHIPQYKKVLKKICKSLKNNGKFIIWVYGKEGNEVYLFIFNNLRRLSIILPDFILRLISKILTLFTYPYGYFCNFISLPLHKYFIGMFNKLSFKHRSYVIFDQLNPSFAKYFTKLELENELKNAGFEIEYISDRLDYSYTAICSKNKSK